MHVHLTESSDKTILFVEVDGDPDRCGTRTAVSMDDKYLYLDPLDEPTIMIRKEALDVLISALTRLRNKRDRVVGMLVES